MTPAPAIDPIEAWRAAWPKALAAWSRFTRLRDPRLCASGVEAMREGMGSSFAMIRLLDQSVVVDLEQVHMLGLDDYAVEILAHEVGHHVLAPNNATDHVRLLARMRKALPTLEGRAPMVANLFTDLLINDRLQRQAGLRMADIYARLLAHERTHGSTPVGKVWELYMGIYEQLWQLPRGELGGPTDDARVLGDAWLGARLVRVYAQDWMAAGGRFASLLLPYLVDEEAVSGLDRLHDTREAARGCEPAGAGEIEDDEADGAMHPSQDPRVTGEDAPQEHRVGTEPPKAPGHGGGQYREPFEYGEILRAGGIQLSDHDIAVRYYRERALPHLVRFPTRVHPESQEPQLEGLEPWELGDPMDELDWLQTLLQSPKVVPGVTTVRRVYGREPAREPERTPVDLDMYVDSSGSMPNPQTHTSFLALAGAIIALSALRTGSRVQATLWASKGEVLGTTGFVRDEDAILRVLTGYFGGGTTFPIHRLRDTFAARTPTDRAVHVLQISDDGITSMFAVDERGNSGWDVAARALRVGRAGGTMALNIHPGWAKYKGGWQADLQRAAKEGWDIHAIAAMEDLVAFARAFSRRHYEAVAAEATP
jgi:hypothetical protein